MNKSIREDIVNQNLICPNLLQQLDFESRQNSSAAATASEVSGKAVNGPFQFVKSECHPSNSVTHDDSPVCAANASPKAQDNIGNQESTFVLPDLNLPVDEDISANIMHYIELS